MESGFDAAASTVIVEVLLMYSPLIRDYRVLGQAKGEPVWTS